MKPKRLISKREIVRTLNGDGRRQLRHSFVYRDAPRVWDPCNGGGFVLLFVEDDLFIACAEYIRDELGRAFQTLEELREYAHAHNWDDLASFDEAILEWAKRSDVYAVCTRCAAPLEMSAEFHARRGSLAYAKCPTCSLYFVRRSPAHTAEERVWQIEPDPPEIVRDPNWWSDVKRELAGNAPNAELGDAPPDGGPEK